MILHLIPAEKFTIDYIKRIYKLFDHSDHTFVIYGEDKKEYRIDEVRNMQGVIVTSTLLKCRSKIIHFIDNCSMIVCHSLFLKVQDLSFLNRVLTNKNKSICWAIWGKDLYEDSNAIKTSRGLLKLKAMYKESIRKKLIKNMSGFITTGDYDALKERYRIQENAFVEGAQYTYDLIPSVDIKCNKDEFIHVMIGHSATDTCRHIETMDRISPYKDKIKVYCPMSYPNDREYIDKVSNYGKKMFGDNFFPITSFMGYKEYVAFLCTIDIGIFNNSRQQGMGNITNLLYLGKKVYLSEDNTIIKSYPSEDYYIYNYSDITDKSFLTLLSSSQISNNRKKIEYKFSDENFMSEWKRIFDGKRKE